MFYMSSKNMVKITDKQRKRLILYLKHFRNELRLYVEDDDIETIVTILHIGKYNPSVHSELLNFMESVYIENFSVK